MPPRAGCHDDRRAIRRTRVTGCTTSAFRARAESAAASSPSPPAKVGSPPSRPRSTRRETACADSLPHGFCRAPSGSTSSCHGPKIKEPTRDVPGSVWIVAPPGQANSPPCGNSVTVIERLTDMPSGTVGFRAAGEIEREDYDEVLVPELHRALEAAVVCGRST
jgi:hypothetical protein